MQDGYIDRLPINLYTCGIKHGNNKIRYVLAKQIPGDPVSSEYLASTEAGAVIAQFAAVRDAKDSSCDKPIAEMIHSFSADESKTMTPEVVNKIGREVATTMFPGHQVLIVTHLDRDHYHNHILINRHHLETGKLIRDNFPTLKKLRSTNDRICQSYGLSIPNQDGKVREARVPKSVAQMIKHGRASYIADMMQKADYARSIATNYDQYQGILAEFGVKVRIEQKNISYHYPGRDIPKRGKNMGALYDKPGLEQAFKTNDEKFRENPQLRNIIKNRMYQSVGNPEKLKSFAKDMAKETNGHFKSGVKDYSKHKVVPRREAGWARASEEALSQCLVPIDEMRKAHRTSIVGYCKQNGIALEQTSPGKYEMIGRPYVEISEFEWRNKKNNTRGNLIDLVAAHKQISFLEAISEINGNKRLLLLQKEIGEVKRSYTSFYIPKVDHETSHSATNYLGHFLHQHGVQKEFASELLKSGQAQVAKGGMIRLFAKDDTHGTVEYVKDGNDKWPKQKHGQFTQPFFSLNGTGRKANIYSDPLTFMQAQKKRLFRDKRGSEAILAIMEPCADIVDRFLSGHRSIDTIRIVTIDPGKPTRAELDFFENLKSRYQSHSIAIDFISIEKSMPGRSFSLER